jgi:hypothetical protein
VAIRLAISFSRLLNVKHLVNINVRQNVEEMPAKSIKSTEKRMGRPATGHDPIFNMRLSETKQEEIRQWAEANGIRGLSEAARQLIDIGLQIAKRRGRRKARK